MPWATFFRPDGLEKRLDSRELQPTRYDIMWQIARKKE